MGLTISGIKSTVFGDQRVAIADVTFDSSYPTGGEALDLGQLGLGSVNFMQFGSLSGYMFGWDGTNKKIKAFTPTNAADGDAAEAAPADEVANTTDMHTVTVRIMAYGL